MSDNGSLPFRGASRGPDDVHQHVLLRPELDEVFEHLCDRHCRLVLLLVKEDAVETVTDVLFWAEEDTATIELELIHNHLPKLTDAGYVDWDRQTGELARGAHFDSVEPFLELIETHTEELPDDWP